MRLAAVFALAALAACGETVVTDGSGGAGGAGGQGAGGGIPTCSPVPAFAGTFGWTYTSPDGALHDCSPDTEDAIVDVVGTIAPGSSGGTWDIDACDPAADCVPEIHTLTVTTDAPLEPPPVGTVVRLSLSLEHVSGPPPINCRQTLVVQNAPT
ncbi:MAG TPA: hypothetical protein VL400_09755, partial [Polyangiaceae bacterium]|nr:hypothetical protein [Polyangiaceae bacterium]